ncbi:MAG: transcription elongation factor GreB [Alphaproteobacteria bacterium]|nr:transcription elongation factor GreB [Alphaproteobacteria bacterium]
MSQQHYMTPKGYRVLEKELYWLLHDERPKIVDVVSWAAGNGDRSENGDYIYNKKRLREIDRRVRYLTKKLENTTIVDPARQQNLTRVFFGAKVKYLREDDSEVTVQLVDVDEADYREGKINWLSPVGRALLKAEEGDEVKVLTDQGEEYLEILEITYPLD